MAFQTLTLAPGRFNPAMDRLLSWVGSASRSAAGRRLAWTVFVWAIAYITLTISNIGGETSHQLEFAGRRAMVCLAGVAMSWTANTLVEMYAQSLKTRLIVVILISIPLGVAYGITNEYFLNPLEKFESWSTDVISNIIQVSSGMYFVFVASPIAWFMAMYAVSNKEKDIALAEMRTHSLEIQNRMLMYQVRPHFLFNTLNALSALVLDRRNTDAEKMITSLATFLRNSLEVDPDAQITLSRELEVQRQYLAIEMIRFNDRMFVEENIPDALLDALVPALILQPVIENAVKYAVAPSPHAVTIRIEAHAVGDRLQICIADTGSASPPPDTPRLGIGLGNVKSRLELGYGNAASLRAAVPPGGGFMVTLTLPLER